MIAGLKKQEKQLKREIDRKRKQAEALDRKLEQLIAEEERKSSTRADKTEGKILLHSSGLPKVIR